MVMDRSCKRATARAWSLRKLYYNFKWSKSKSKFGPKQPDCQRDPSLSLTSCSAFGKAHCTKHARWRAISIIWWTRLSLVNNRPKCVCFSTARSSIDLFIATEIYDGLIISHTGLGRGRKTGWASKAWHECGLPFRSSLTRAMKCRIEHINYAYLSTQVLQTLLTCFLAFCRENFMTLEITRF